jgi:hypothetical protein
MKMGPFPFGLNNVAKSCQILLQEAAGSVQGIPLTRAQEGLVPTMTPQDCLVHWPGSIPRSNDTRLINVAAVLPYHEGRMLHNINDSTEIIDNFDGAITDTEAIHAREVFMIWRPPLIPPRDLMLDPQMS